MNRLTDLIDSLLELSRPAESLNLLDTPVERTLGRAIELVRAHPQFHKIALEMDSTGKHSASFDRRKMERVFYNLLLNACQAAQVSGGHVSVGVSEQEDNLSIRITDDGPGVEGTIRDKLFQPFVSYGKENGTGLGLTIAQKIVQDHHGSLQLQRFNSGPYGDADFAAAQRQQDCGTGRSARKTPRSIFRRDRPQLRSVPRKFHFALHRGAT